MTNFMPDQGYFNIFPSEDIDYVISRFSRLFLQTVNLLNINNNKKNTSWIKDLNFILVLKLIFYHWKLKLISRPYFEEQV